MTICVPSFGASNVDLAAKDAEFIVSGELLLIDPPTADLHIGHSARVDALLRITEVLKGDIEVGNIIRVVHYRGGLPHRSPGEDVRDIASHPETGALWFLVRSWRGRGTFEIIHGDAVWQDDEMLRAKIMRRMLTDVGYNALFLAESAKDVAAAIRQGISINERDANGDTALHWAIEHGRKEVVAALLASGAHTNIPGAFSQNALDLSLYIPREEITALLSKQGARAYGIFLRAGNLSLARYEEFLAHGADVNVTTEDGRTPLLVQLDKDHQVQVQWLLEHGALASYPDGHEPPLHRLFVSNLCKGKIHLAELLLTAGADINSRDSSGVTALMKARICEDGEDIFKWLIANGADVGAVDECGVTPLFQYLARGNPFGSEGVRLDIARVFLQAGADPNTPDQAKLSPQCQAKYYGGWYSGCVSLEECESIVALLDRYRDTYTGASINGSLQ